MRITMISPYLIIAIIILKDSYSLPHRDSNNKVRSVQIVQEDNLENFVNKEHDQLRENIQQHGNFTNSAVEKMLYSIPFGNIDEHVIDDLLSKSSVAITNLRTLLQKNIDDAVNLFETLRRKMNKHSLKITDMYIHQLEKLIQLASDEVEKNKRRSSDPSMDISECLKLHPSSDFLFQKFRENEVQCMQHETNKAMNIIDEAVEIFTGVYKITDDHSEKLKECSTDKNVLFCVKNVIAEAASIEKDLPIKIETKVDEVQNFVVKYTERTQMCVIEEIANAGYKISHVAGEINRCVSRLDYSMYNKRQNNP